MKKALSIIIAICCVFSVLAFCPVGAEKTVDAKTEMLFEKVQDITYLNDSEKTITAFEVVTPPTKQTYNSALDHIVEYTFDEITGTPTKHILYRIDFEGIVVKVSYSDGSSTLHSYSDTKIDPLLYLVEYDYETQYDNPWTEGENTVTLSYKGFSDTITVSLVMATITGGRIVEPPACRSSVIYGDGHYNDDQTAFYYNIRLDGTLFELTASNGEKRTYSYSEEALNIVEELYAVDNQENAPWGTGKKDVQLYYNNIFLGTYTYTVEYKFITSYEFLEEASYAVYYPDLSTDKYVYDIDLDSIVVRANYSGSTYSDISFADIYNDVGDGRYFDIIIMPYGDNLIYSVYRPVYPGYLDEDCILVPFDIIHGKAESIEITNPPASLSYIHGYGFDYVGNDLTGLTAEITMQDGRILKWTWDESFKENGVIFNGSLLTLTDTLRNEENGLLLSYMGAEVFIPCNDTKYVYDYVYGEITENCTIELTPEPTDHYNFYKFTAWDNGEYEFSTDGNPEFVVAVAFDSEGHVINDTITLSRDHENPNVSFSINAQKGDVYYLVVEGLFDTDEPTFSLSVFHEMSYTRGDLNDDGEINMNDLLVMRKFLLGILTTEDINVDAACLSGSSIPSMQDLLVMRKYLLGLITEI